MTVLALDKLLQKQGFGSRKACQALIRDGLVKVAGEVVEDADARFESEGLLIEVDGEPWVCRAQLYVVLNKPRDYECSRKPSHHPSVMKLLPPLFTARDVQPVGRLDHDTTGLLLMSDDGQFIHRQSSPKHHVPKIYVATTHEPVTDALVAKLLAGVKLVDEPEPIAAQACRALDANRLEIVLAQGKYHQVKRMLAAAGNHCEALVRTAIGGLRLADLDLPEGEWRFLDPAQQALLACPAAVDGASFRAYR